MEKDKRIFPFRKHPVGELLDGKKGRKQKADRLRDANVREMRHANTRKMHRALGILLAAAVLFNTLSVDRLAVYASNGEAELCEHHTEHTAECGYAEAQPCTHEHGEECYKTVTECVHTHTDECYPETEETEESGCITKVLDCHHEHDENCGYKEAQECGYVCEVCNGTEPEDIEDNTENDTEDAGTDTEECICETLCTEDSINGDCPVCGAEDADLSRCKGEKTEEQEATGEKVITAWEWIDPEEYLTDGMLALPGAGRENPAFAEDVTALLPEKIQAKVAVVNEAEDGEETEEDAEAAPETEDAEITLAGWECAAYPEDGAYEGAYTFTAFLPEGFMLAEDAAALEVKVELGGAKMLLRFGVSAAYQKAAWDESKREVVCTEETADSCTPVENSAAAVTWYDGWYVVNSTVTITEPITVSGEVNLILADGCTLNAEKGIVVTTGNSLTIYAQSVGTGTLNATGTDSAGIGGAGRTDYGVDGGSSGAITIHGGNITATSENGAGIGGGAPWSGANGGSGSNITIYGGSVTAQSTGTMGGAGIGGGGGNNGGTGSNIQIYGGTIKATGSSLGAGIGGGGAGAGGTSGAGTNITISGGTVTAVGGNYAAGIGGGGGYSSSGNYGTNVTGGTGSVTISGGIVDASSPTDVYYSDYKGAPIGNGGNTSGAESVTKTAGIIFENKVGTVYGTVTLTEPFTVPDGYSLTFAEGAAVKGELNVPGVVAVAEKDGNIIGYYYDAKSLAAAFARSGNAGAAFTLLDNVDWNDFLEIQINCTLDLNGHNIHNTSVYGLATKNGTTVTIRGQGQVISDGHRGLFVGGTVTLEGGTFIGASSYSGVSVSDSGVLNVTGKDVVIEVSGGGCGLELNYSASAQLSAGTYKGGKAIQITNSSKTLADLLGTDGNYAYYGEDNKPIALSELEGQTELTGVVTVRKCDHAGAESTPNGDGTHNLNCQYCGYTGQENCDSAGGDVFYTGTGEMAPTCTEAGLGHRECTKCGSVVESGIVVKALGHTGGTATCSKGAVCTRCNQPYGDTDSSVHAHTEVRGFVAATCTAGGYTGDTYCKDCGAKTKTGNATPASGHNYTGTVTKEPTTGSEGTRTYTCDRCGHSYTESIPKLPEETHRHSYADSVTKQPTCTDTGVRTYTCSCGDSYIETIAALGHHYQSSVTKQPTATAEGTMTYTCDRCGHSYIRPIEKLPGDDTARPGDDTARPGDDTAKPGDDTAKPKTSQPGDTEPGGGSTEETRPDTGIPFIKDKDGKIGWDVIRAEGEQAEENGIINVDMNGTTVVPGDIIDSIRGKDFIITFDMGNGIIWSVDGKSIITDKAGDIDFSVQTGVNTVPVDIVNNVTGERYSIQLSLAYEGEFGFTAVLSINLGEENKGYTASLYYYNESTGELEFICSDEVAEDGAVSLAFTHASDYVIAIDGDEEKGSGGVTEPVQPEDQDADSTGQTEESPQSGREWKPWGIAAAGVLVAGVGIGMFFMMWRKREEDSRG